MGSLKRIYNSFSTYGSIAKTTVNFAPQCQPPCKADIDRLQAFLSNTKKLLALTGAGISTESGIPDYRSESVGLYARTNRRPVQHADFVKFPSARQRYWARNYVGWSKFSAFLPNKCHLALAEWEKRQTLMWLVTQNVDSLHTKAGSKKLTELHGCTYWVVCLQCAYKQSRFHFQILLEQLNPDFGVADAEFAPDGDVLLSDEKVKNFKVPSCDRCGGILKPDVVFFGDNVSQTVVTSVYDLVADCDKLMVIGSSLHVYSGYRFVQRAADLKKPIAILNCGPTKADHLAQVKVSAICGEVLPLINLAAGQPTTVEWIHN